MAGLDLVIGGQGQGEYVAATYVRFRPLSCLLSCLLVLLLHRGRVLCWLLLHKVEEYTGAEYGVCLLLLQHVLLACWHWPGLYKKLHLPPKFIIRGAGVAEGSRQRTESVSQRLFQKCVIPEGAEVKAMFKLSQEY